MGNTIVAVRIITKNVKPFQTLEWLTQSLCIKTMYHIFDFCPTSRKLLCKELLKEWRKEGGIRGREGGREERSQGRTERGKRKGEKEGLPLLKLQDDLIQPWSSHLLLKIKPFSNMYSHRGEVICLLNESNTSNIHHPGYGIYLYSKTK